MSAKELRTFTCSCCGVLYEIELEKYELSPFACDSCVHHRDAATVEELLAQRRDHAALWNANIADMNERVAEAERRTQSVYHTRGLALEALNKINAAHDMRPSGKCSCGGKTCRVGAMIGENRVLSNVVRAYDAREQRRLREIAHRDGFWDSADEWDDFIDRSMVDPAQPETERHEDAG